MNDDLIRQAMSELGRRGTGAAKARTKEQASAAGKAGAAKRWAGHVKRAMTAAQRATAQALRALQAAARVQGCPWRGHTVRLSWYGTLEDYATFRPDLRPEGHEEFARRTHDLVDAIKASGAKVMFVPIRADAFRAWLTAGEHPKPTAALRGQFIHITMNGAGS